MDLLFKREQNKKWRGRVVFRLWVKAEMSDDERSLIERYDMGASCLIAADDFDHLKGAIAFGLVALLVFGVGGALATEEVLIGLATGVIAALGSGYWWLNEKRETIWMRDLIYGRRFKCDSIIDLVKKEAMLENACIALRQVLETAKHWDGVEARPVPKLAPEEAKEVVLRLG